MIEGYYKYFSINNLFTKGFATMSLPKISLHKMKIQENYLKDIQGLKKVVEVRLYKEKYKKIQTGDLINFYSINQVDQNLFCRVEKKCIYSSFKIMLLKEGIERCLPGIKNLEQAQSLYYSFPFYKQNELLYGVVAFHIKYIEEYNDKQY